MKDKKHLLQPHYQRNTAAMLLKDTELNRIVKNDEKFGAKVDALTAHYEEVRQEKPSLSNLRLTRLGSIHNQAEKETARRKRKAASGYQEEESHCASRRQERRQCADYYC